MLLKTLAYSTARLRSLVDASVCVWIASLVSLSLTASAGLPLHERFAAWHRSVVVTQESDYTSAFMTYCKQRPEQVNQSLLLKLVPSLDGKTVPRQVQHGIVEDFPGGIQANLSLPSGELAIQFMPLTVGREAESWEGAALYTIQGPSTVPCGLLLGGGTMTSFLTKPSPELAGDSVQPLPEAKLLDPNTLLFKSGLDAFYIALKTDGVISLEANRASAQFALGKGYVLMAYAETAERALSLAEQNPEKAREEITGYYETLLQSRIDTPVPNLNAAFRTAVYNLEYTWVAPYGWMETIRHWLAMWHMQHTAGAEWLGQTDRSRACTLTLGRKLLANGAVPQLWPNGMTHRDFGGSNQFWAWQVRHYLKFTGDKDFAREVASQLDKVLAQTYREYDPDGNLLLGWSQQIGNQEDMFGTPNDGSTASIEGINMMRTRSEIAALLGDLPTLAEWSARAQTANSRLKQSLWKKDLGRYVFFRDPLGELRLDGQYHTLLYPLIWGLADELDGYTSLRQFKDRLTGAHGEAYCSNNFPNHVSGTWGMQTGVAQQPWAAWAYSAAGWRNDTWRPLAAAADWAMQPGNRGAWPEVAAEQVPAYFSPPAGLFVASVAEALFGLQVDRLSGILTISPSFPDDWDHARLDLPEYSVRYDKRDNHVRYEVSSRDALPRHVEWRLPLGSVLNVKVNGLARDARSTPGVNQTSLQLTTDAESKTSFEFDIAPATLVADYEKSLAEGDTLSLRLSEGWRCDSIMDRSGLLTSWRRTQDGIQADLATGLLEPYEPLGRLGQLNFSRRTFFACCRNESGLETWMPIDFTVLPRFEAVFEEPAVLDGTVIKTHLRVRNNTSTRLKSSAHLRVARTQIPVDLDLASRSEQVYEIAIPTEQATLATPGANSATLVLNNDAQETLELSLSLLEIFRNDTLQSFVRAQCAPIPLPESEAMPDTDWKTLRDYPGFPHVPWSNSPPPLQGIAKGEEIVLPGLPGIRFIAPDRRFLPVSWKAGRPRMDIPLGEPSCRKVYLLLLPLLDNHDVFSKVSRVTLRGKNSVLFSRDLSTPGDLDWWPSAKLFGDTWATATAARPLRTGLLPFLLPAQGDWQESHPPLFPQQAWWAACPAWIGPSATLNVVELDPGVPVEAASVVVETIGANPALGVVAVSVLRGDGTDALETTPFAVPPQYRTPRTVFRFDQPEDLAGWTLEGDAFAVIAEPRLFQSPTLNSLGRAGETAMGVALSPVFTLAPTDRFIELDLQGGHSKIVNGKQTLTVELVDAATGTVLGTQQPAGSHIVQPVRIPVEPSAPIKVQLRLTDASPETSYAWIGLGAVRVGSKNG